MIAMLPIPVGETDDDASALEIGAYMFGGGFLNSRLAKRLRGDEGLCYGVSAWVSMSPYESRGEFGAYAIFAPQNTTAVEVGIKQELQKAVRDGFTSEELVAAKSGMLQQARVSRSQDENLVGRLADNLLLKRTILWDKQFEEKLNGLSIETVNAAFKRYIDPSKLSIVKAGDSAKTK